MQYFSDYRLEFQDFYDFHDSLLKLYDVRYFVHDSRMEFYNCHDFRYYRMEFYDFHDFHNYRINKSVFQGFQSSQMEF